MALRWESVPAQPGGRSYWYLLEDHERLAMLSVQQPCLRSSPSCDQWQRVEIAPETWLVAGATLELLPGIQIGRLSHVQLPPLHDGPLALTLPPLP